jgi:hypothetical protein
MGPTGRDEENSSRSTPQRLRTPVNKCSNFVEKLPPRATFLAGLADLPGANAIFTNRYFLKRCDLSCMPRMLSENRVS